MASRSETLGAGGGSQRNAWIALAAIVLIAAMLAIGALIGSNAGTTAPAGTAAKAEATVVRDTDSPGLIKGGLQPRPFSPIEVDEPATSAKVPNGFIQMPGGEVRPMPGR
jgi:hypothetical protein